MRCRHRQVNKHHDALTSPDANASALRYLDDDCRGPDERKCAEVHSLSAWHARCKMRLDDGTDGQPSPAADIGPQGERVWPISVVESTRRREEKNYRLSHRDVSGGRCGIVIKPTRQASAIGRVYRRPSLMVGGRHEQASPIARWSSTSLFVRISSCSFFPACNLSRTIQLSI